MIDITKEQLATLSKATHWLPKKGDQYLHPATLWRWSRRGVRGVRLETVRIGGVLHTSQEALQRFTERLTETDTAPQSPTSREREAAIRRADRELEALGV